jgi:hypothetical protein
MWTELTPQMRSSGIKGPVFISIGEGDQLKTFLDNNPKIAKVLTSHAS